MVGLAGGLLAGGCLSPAGDTGAGEEVSLGCESRATCEPGDLLAGCAACVKAEASFDLEDCTKGLSREQVEDELALAVGFVGSLGALDDADRAGERLAESFRDVLYSLAFEPERDQLPEPFVHEGGGVYTMRLATPGDSRLSARLLFGEGYEAGEGGDPIEVSAFQLGAYLTGAEVSPHDLVADVTFTGTGPLVEMFGEGAAPMSPMTVDLLGVEVETRKQTVESTITVDESSEEAGKIKYSVITRRLVLAPNLGDTELRSGLVTGELVSAEIANPARGQTGTIDSYDRETPIGGKGWGGVKSAVKLTVKGGAFDHVVDVRWIGEPRPVAAFSCAP